MTEQTENMGPAIDLSLVDVPEFNSKVFKDDCMFSFDTAFDKNGLDICMKCHQAFSRGEIDYTQMHSEFYGHSVFLNYKKIRKVLRDEEKPSKMIKLEIKETSENDLFDSKYSIYLQQLDKTLNYPDNELPLKVTQAVEGLINATSIEKKEEIKSWEQEIKPCKHSDNIVQTCIENLQLERCNDCDLTENLWICLYCGNLGCGRSQFGGVPGNSHAVEHYKEHSGHPVAVKLGSLSSDLADCYCYSCDDEIKVPNLSNLLKTFGIDITKFVRTEKSLTELQIEQNIQWDFKMQGDGDEALKPVFGSGLTGFKNLGNSCYLNSVLQMLFSIESFQEAFVNPNGIPLDKILGNFKPYEDLETQMFKLGDGLFSGRYSIPDENTTDSIKYQRGIKPTGFKNLVGQGHPEFSTMLQQDAFEFWTFLIDKLETKKVNGQLDPLSPLNKLKFVVENKIKCRTCNGVRIKLELADNLTLPIDIELLETDGEGNKVYKPTTMEKSFEIWNNIEDFEYSCPKCKSTQPASRTQGLKSMPEYFVINPQRIQLENWVPTKITVPINLDQTLNVDNFKCESLLPNEEEFPDEDEAEDNNDQIFEFDQQTMNSLLEMGFPENRAKHAIYETGNSGSDAAMNWLFSHMDDPKLDEPFKMPENNSNINITPNIDTEKLASLTSMGFGEQISTKALVLNNGNVEAAVEWLFANPEDDGVIELETSGNNNSAKLSIKEQIEKLIVENDSGKMDSNYELLGVICHKGTGVHSGHYVVFIKKVVDGELRWVLFNDEKVVLATQTNLKEIEKSGYIYVYKHI